MGHYWVQDMKKLPAFLNTPAKLMLAIGLIILASEFLIMVLIESIHHTIMKDAFLTRVVFEFADPILLTALVSPALYLLIFKPLRSQQAELERQLDELRRFQKVTVGRELRMKELVEENAVLRRQLAAAQPDDTHS